MNDLYKPVDVKRLMELAGTRKLPEADADVPTDYKSLASPEVQANYNKGGQRPDPTDALIANRMGANVPQADLAKAAQTRPAGPTATVPTATAAAAPTAAPTAAISVPDAQDFGSEPKKNEPVVTTTPVPAPTPVTATPLAARPAYAGSAGSQAIQKLNPDLIKDVNKIYPGQQFKLPGGGTYTVKKGDTLDAIARSATKPAAPAASPVANNPTQSPYVPQVQNYRPGVANAGRMRQNTASADTPVAANPELGFGPGKQAPITAADYQALRGQPAAPTTPAPRTSAYSQARANQQVRETSADLGRMQSLAGIRKN